jgi:hypothetical protein
MQTFVTGYQYGSRNQFIGQYLFEAHADFEPHMPPNTVLVSPPEAPEGQEAIWTGDAWTLQEKPQVPAALKIATTRVDPEIPVIPIPEPVLIPVPEYIAPVIPS